MHEEGGEYVLIIFTNTKEATTSAINGSVQEVRQHLRDKTELIVSSSIARILKAQPKAIN